MNINTNTRKEHAQYFQLHRECGYTNVCPSYRTQSPVLLGHSPPLSLFGELCHADCVFKCGKGADDASDTYEDAPTRKGNPEEAEEASAEPLFTPLHYAMGSKVQPRISCASSST